jgi:class 3 adenylate cyclase/pimeloyl-ACP methyl ester carboxylesterase
MDSAPTRYLDRDGAALAYQVTGSGPVNVVIFCEVNQHLDLCWTDPHIHALYERVAGYSQFACLQRRGFGLSDPVTYMPTVEQQADDIIAVMDAAGMERATLAGMLGTCSAAALVAARAPERVSGLVLMNPVPQGPLSSSTPPIGWTQADVDYVVSGYRTSIKDWGSGLSLDLWDLGLASAHNHRLAGMLERCSSGPTAVAAYLEWLFHLDIQDVLRSVQAPTRVVRVARNSIPEAAVRYAAELIPGATYHELAPTQPGWSIGRSFVEFHDHLEEVATGSHRRGDADRFLGSVLFTDVVASTELLANVGDEVFKDLMADHEQRVRHAVDRADGHLVRMMGDGSFSVFDGPSRAVRCAEEICASAAELGIEVRAGTHTGEIERHGKDYAGMTVHIGARVSAAAGPGQVLVSRTVRDLLVGSTLSFASCGERELKGGPGRWELFALNGSELASVDLSGSAPTTPLDRAVLQTARRAPRLVRAAVRVGDAWQRRRATELVS